MLGKLSGFMFAPPDQQPAAIEAYIGLAKKYHAIVERNLTHHGGKFAAGDQITIADFVMASHIGNYIENANFPLAQQMKESLAETPKFQTYCQTVLETFSYLKTRPQPLPPF